MSWLPHPHNDTMSPDCIPHVQSLSPTLSSLQSLTHYSLSMTSFSFSFPHFTHAESCLLLCRVLVTMLPLAHQSVVLTHRVDSGTWQLKLHKLEFMQRLQTLRTEDRDRSQCNFSRISAYSKALSFFAFICRGVYGLNSWSETTEKEHKITTWERTREWAIGNYLKNAGKEEETKKLERQWVRAILLQEMKL